MSYIIFLNFLALFLIFALPSTRADEVTFNGKFRCNIPSQSDDYCMLLRYMEEDPIDDDPISIGRVKCGGPSESSVHAKFNGGDGPFNYYYEFYVDIVHSCTHDGDIKLFRHSFPDTRIDTKNKEFNYEVELTDKGFPIDDYFDWGDVISSIKRAN